VAAAHAKNDRNPIRNRKKKILPGNSFAGVIRPSAQSWEEMLVLPPMMIRRVKSGGQTKELRSTGQPAFDVLRFPCKRAPFRDGRMGIQGGSCNIITGPDSSSWGRRMRRKSNDYPPEAGRLRCHRWIWIR
jgi:hypothetical protein